MAPVNVTDRPHGIMFHHFYDEKHCKGQGAISATQLEGMIDHYRDRLLPAETWYAKALRGSLKAGDVCLTFDDCLLCQYEIAAPVLRRRGLTAFWFVYSAVLTGSIEMLEVYRKFRTTCFSDIDDYYRAFFAFIDRSEYRGEVESGLKDYSHERWGGFPFYTKSDTKFRYVRNFILGREKYDHIMGVMMRERGIDPFAFASDLWMKPEHVKELKARGNVIGLHSHTHPTTMSKLSLPEQEKEYGDNFDFLRGLLGEKPLTVSHPCNSYNEGTLDILKSLGIRLGFRANMEDGHYSALEMPREDHANVTRSLKK